MTKSGELSVDIENRIARVTFSHPAANSFPSLQLQKLTDTIQELGHNSSVSLILLTADGDGAFCAGASFDELLAVRDQHEGTLFFSGFANVINAMRKCPKLIVGRIHGKAVGGGVGLAAACDYAFATSTAEIKLSELAIGIGPFVIAPAVERRIGLNALTELTLNPHEWKSAQWAHLNHLYSGIYANSTLLDDAINSFCGRLVKYNPDALSETKKALWHGTEHWGSLLYERAAISGTLITSDYTKKALEGYRK